jgi:hypothetical protein
VSLFLNVKKSIRRFPFWFCSAASEKLLLFTVEPLTLLSFLEIRLARPLYSHGSNLHVSFKTVRKTDSKKLLVKAFV